MKEYDFKIKRDGVWYDIDLQEKPVMSYQINNLGELNNRHVNYSQALTAPITPKNSKALGYPELNDVATVVPYSKYECRLFVEDSELAGVGSYCILYNIDKDYKLQILGNAEFFGLMSELLLTNLSSFTASRRYDSMNPTIFNAGIFKYAVMSSVLNRVSGFEFPDVEHIEQLPVLMLKEAVGVLLEELGYTANYLSTPANYDKVALTLKELNSFGDVLNPYRTTTPGEVDSAITTNRYPTYEPSEVSENIGQIEIDYSESGYAYPVEFIRNNLVPGVNHSIKLDFLAPTTTEIRIIVKRFDGDSTTTIYNDGVTGFDLETVTVEIDVDAIDIDKIGFIDVVIYATSATWQYSVLAKIYPISDVEVYPEVPQFGNIALFPNTGFTTALDLFKVYTNLLGLMVQVNEVTKTVNLCTLNYIISQKDSALDWTNKIEYAEVFDKSFDLGFAQRNKLTLQPNEIDTITNEGVIECNNETLAIETTIIDIPIESGRDIKLPNLDAFAKVNQFETDPETGIVSFVGCTPHAVIITDETMSVNIKNSSTTLASYTWNIAQHYSMTAAASGAYAGLTQMLTNPLKIKCRMFLTPQDIAALNQVIPVYLHQFGKYFYINKISNYQFGEKTEVELIKIIG